MGVALITGAILLVWLADVRGARDCNPSPSGRYYVGHTSVTVSGRSCQHWTSQSPYRPVYNRDDMFPDGSAVAAANYCRNPSGWYEGLWCYTTNSNKRWEACGVPACGLEVFRQCRDEDQYRQVFKLDRCPADRIIYIASAKVGVGSIRWSNIGSQCRLGRSSQCRTYHPEIMHCNGRRNCSFSRDVFNQRCWWQSQWRQVNFIDIRYNCIDGVRDCNPSPDGRYYVGNTSETVSGKTCQAWTSQSPHNHTFYNRDDLFPDGRVNNAVNYCRNPNGWRGGLWCYTTNRYRRWDRCNVPACETSTNTMTPTTTTVSQPSQKRTEVPETSRISTVAVLQTSTSAVFNAPTNADSTALSMDALIGIIVAAVLLLLVVVIVIIIVTVVILRKRRKARNAQNRQASTPNIYGTSHDNGGLQPSAPPPRSSLSHDLTLIDNDLYQDTTAHPTAETPSNTVEMSPMGQHPAPPVYAVVQKKNRPGNVVAQSEASAPASASRPTTDHDTTLIDNDLYQ